jgi:hypothetical protein
LYLYEFIHVDVPLADVRLQFLAGGGAWLSPIATQAYVEDGVDPGADGISESDVVEVEDVDHPYLHKQVVVELGEPFDRDRLVTIPMRWRAKGLRGVFPTMDAEFEIAQLGDTRTHICVMGRYDPPLGPVGRTLDRILLHHLAEAGVRSFLRRVALAVGATEADLSAV